MRVIKIKKIAAVHCTSYAFCNTKLLLLLDHSIPSLTSLAADLFVLPALSVW